MPKYIIHYNKDEYRKLNTDIMKLSQLILKRSDCLSIDDIVEFNDLIENISEINAKLNRRMIGKLKCYQMLNIS